MSLNGKVAVVTGASQGLGKATATRLAHEGASVTRRGAALYAASKAAVSAMALNLASELGERGITINAIAPGGTATNMAQEYGKLYTPPALRNVPPDLLMKSKTALQRMAQPEGIAAAVAFLVSDDASYITGSTLAVDGRMM